MILLNMLMILKKGKFTLYLNQPLMSGYMLEENSILRV